MRQDLLDKYHDINVDHDWYVWTLEDFASQMRDNYGVEVRNIHFSGFWSQGDGASFEVIYTDLWPVLGRLGLQDKYPAWSLGEHGFAVTRFAGSYTHRSNNMQCDVDASCDCGEEHRDVVYAAVSNEYCAIRATQLMALEGELLSFFRDRACELYKELEAEYEYLTSDEVVWGTIEANGLNEETEDETE